MTMQEVRIRKSHNCISYAADRLGVAFPYDSVKELIGSNDFDRFKYNQDDLEIGDLIVWTDEIESVVRPLIIKPNGLIISTSRSEYGHVGVYEGSGLFSECVYEGIYPYVQYSDINEYHPDMILRIRY